MGFSAQPKKPYVPSFCVFINGLSNLGNKCSLHVYVGQCLLQPAYLTFYSRGGRLYTLFPLYKVSK